MDNGNLLEFPMRVREFPLVKRWQTTPCEFPCGYRGSGYRGGIIDNSHGFPRQERKFHRLVSYAHEIET